MGKLRLIASTALTHPGYQDASTPLIPQGWGNGEFYTREVDPTNAARMIVEPGETTQVWYFAPDSTDGYTQAEIATAEGVSAGTITPGWLNNPAQNTAGWGRRSDLPLAWAVGGSADIGTTLFLIRFSPSSSVVRSEWAMFKRGGSYNTALIDRSNTCEGPLHPAQFGAFGEGARPQFTVAATRNLSNARQPLGIVYQGLDFRKQPSWNINFDYVMYADCNFTTDDYGISVQGDGAHFTLFGCSFIDCVKGAPAGGDLTWNTGNEDRTSANFISSTDNVLRWRCFYDRNAWSPTYNIDGVTWNSGEFGARPQSGNHDQYDSTGGIVDVTDLENVNVRAAFDAGQWRMGTFGNLLIRAENNFGDLIGVGTADNADRGNVTYYNRIATLGGANKVISNPSIGAGSIGGVGQRGAYFSGITNGVPADDNGYYFVGKNIVAANIIDPAHVDEETSLADARFTKTAYLTSVDLAGADPDTIAEQPNIWKFEQTVFNWGPGNDINAAGISTANRNACTLGRWADAKQAVAAGTNTTDDACDYIRTLSDRCLQAIPIWNYVAGLTGKGTIGHTAGAVATFSPDPDGDGWRTDTPDSWLIDGTRGDFPVDGDDCDLNGNLAYSFMTWRFGDLDFGSGGGFRLYGGYISCTSMQETTEGSIELLGAAQFWIKGNSTADVVVTATGGRLGIDATVSNVRGAFSGKSELLIVAGRALTISTGDTITLTGGDVKAGADGQTGTAALTVNGTLAFVAADGAIASVREFRSGKYGLEVPTAGHTGQPLDPSVTFNVVLASGSEITVDTTGLTAGTYDLIDCDSLTDSGATLPAGVAVVGNKLVLTVS